MVISFTPGSYWRKITLSTDLSRYLDIPTIEQLKEKISVLEQERDCGVATKDMPDKVYVAIELTNSEDGVIPISVSVPGVFCNRKYAEYWVQSKLKNNPDRTFSIIESRGNPKRG